MKVDDQSVLVVDDDGVFRAVVSELLKSRGFDVVEARSAKEATAAIADGNPLLAIVDYRLPEIDGIAWITSVRESGRNFPIVFVSGTWCDEKTFNRLRNLLKVSLILRKPIAPELFVQQIQSVLPAGFKPKDASNPLNALKKLKSNPAREEGLAALKAQYSNELLERWTEITDAFEDTRAMEEVDNQSIANLLSLAHKLAGTAGSVGFKKTGEAAAKIETLLGHYDSTDTIQEVLWTEIERCLKEGKFALDETTQAMTNAIKAAPGALVHKMLLWGPEKNYRNMSLTLDPSTIVEIEVCEGFAALMQRARGKHYDAVIFDLAIADIATVAKSAEDLRSVPGYLGLPLAGIDAPGLMVSESDDAFIGFSTMLPHTPEKGDFERASKLLLSLRELNSSRVLVVDDDPVLTHFVSSILRNEGLVVQVLHEPIKIMEVLPDFNPDLVLLDVMMPGLSGYDVCNMLRADDKWKHLAIVFLTFRSDEDGRSAAFQAGGNDFLSKPVLADELITRVKSQLAEAKRRNGGEGADLKTGSLSGADFVKAANAAALRAEQNNMPFSLCLLSVDGYADLSIEHGMFNAKDAVIELGRLLHRRFRAEDLRGRIGEEGFGIAFSGVREDVCKEMMELLLVEFETLRFSSDTTNGFSASFSAGLAQFPADGSNTPQLLRTANQRLFKGRIGKTGKIF